ncbi:MAG: Ig-like domain-containing protein [Anaerolineales bacterium]
MRQRLGADLDIFDRVALSAILVLALAIIGVVAAGNNIGVQIESIVPDEFARADASVRIRFFDDMQQGTVEERFRISPEREGNLRWNGPRELVFEPEVPWQSGETYQIELDAGARSESGATLRDAIEHTFTAAAPRVTYLSPAGALDRNLYLHDLNTGETQQLTEAEYGVADYDISADGEFIAYTRYNQEGLSDIWIYSMATGTERRVTDCVEAFCSAPEWHPNGREIAYERSEFDPLFGETTARRMWIVDVQSAQSRLMFEDTQVTAHSATYSPNGNRVAVVTTNPIGILVQDFVGQDQVFIETIQGIIGDFSPDSTRLVYPIIVRGAVGSSFYPQLELVDLVAQERVAITGANNAPIEDSTGTWRPTGTNELAVTRRFLDNRYTESLQVYLLNAGTREAEPLIVDEAYNHGFLAWSPDGSMLTMQRLSRSTPGARPEIWVYNVPQDALQQIANDAFMPDFIP